MTRTKKLFVAAAILAAGYGVASLLGEPAAMLLSRNALPDNSAISQTTSVAALPAPVEYAPGELRLVPDARPIEVATPEATLQRPERAPNTLSSDLSLAEVAASPASPASPPNEPAWFSTYNMNGDAVPRATLRNEAPRPLFTEPRTGATTTPASPVGQVNVTPLNAGSPTGQQNGPATNAVVSAEYAEDAARREMEQRALATSAVPSLAEQTTSVVPLAPPPPHQPFEEEASRTHIVVDGDSLSKLAGRYLDDPQRNNEIYELNRHVLSDPELLPIGAELTIPPRNRWRPNGNVPQSALPGSLAVHSAARGGLVPVRPVPSNTVMMPRAQLTRPLPAP